MNVTVGTCSNCGGRVSVPQNWCGVNPPIPTCEGCGARPREKYGPVIDMGPAPQRTLDAIAVDHCKATTETYKP